MDLNLNNIPKHVAIILDGNGRWAKERGKARVYGHRHGAFNLRDVTKYANSIGVRYLTVYCFSTENWKRPNDEVNFLMNTPVWYIKRYWKTMVLGTNIRYKMIGRRDRLPKKLLAAIEEMENETKDHDGLTLTLCIDYGSRDEITSALKNICKDVLDKKLDIDDINEDIITNNLFTKDYPPLDLMIRTSGEYRISNFLLWQMAYSEFYFTKTYFPDFTPEKFKEALIEYQSRNRRFGGLK